MNDHLKSIALFSLLVFIILVATVTFSFSSAIGFALFAFFALKFFFELGETVEIRDLIIVIALLQWIIGPVIKYHIPEKDVFYFMAIPESQYLAFVLPASMLLICGLYFPGVYKKPDSEKLFQSIGKILKEKPNLDIILITIGVVAGIAENFAPISIKFFVYLVGGSRFIGLFFLVMNQRKFKWPIFGAVLVWLFLETVRDAIFHELLLWLIFLFIIIAFLYRFNIRQKLMFLIPFLILMILIQSVKFYFRQEVAAYSGTFDRAGMFTEMVTSELSTGNKTISANNFDAAVDRINQGWIVARIMRYTPTFEPFANGETIISGIQSSLVPRLFNANKAKAGGRDNFERFTGKKLSENTSMGLSPLGEAYANFGVMGGIVFMFLLGLFYNFYISMIIKLSGRFPSLFFWLPLLFLQVVKAETDFVVVLNHLVKASIVVAIIIFAIRKAFAIKI
jgi:hypothetical protein